MWLEYHARRASKFSERWWCLMIRGFVNFSSAEFKFFFVTDVTFTRHNVVSHWSFWTICWFLQQASGFQKSLFPQHCFIPSKLLNGKRFPGSPQHEFGFGWARICLTRHDVARSNPPHVTWWAIFHVSSNDCNAMASWRSHWHAVCWHDPFTLLHSNFLSPFFSIPLNLYPLYRLHESSSSLSFFEPTISSISRHRWQLWNFLWISPRLKTQVGHRRYD